MRRYVLKRILETIPTTIGIIVLTFFLFNVVSGGSPAEAVLGKSATARDLAMFDAVRGYDKPVLFGRWAEVRPEADKVDEELCRKDPSRAPREFRREERGGGTVLLEKNDGWHQEK